METPNKIIEFLRHAPSTANDITDFLGVSRQATHRHLLRMITDGRLAKAGAPPKVYYSIPSNPRIATITATALIIDASTKRVIDDNFLYISPTGERLEGWPGFVGWCTARRQNITQQAARYVQVYNEYEHFKVEGLIDGLPKITATFKTVALDAIYYVDFYSIEEFGKTKLGQLLLYAKQSQVVHLMHEVIEQARPKIQNMVREYNIDGVAFVPPTVRRERQFMKVLQKQLALPVRNVLLEKITTEIVVPQKTLSKLEDRISNAEQTIVLKDRSNYKNILIIDDAIGSGATINIIAEKIRHSGICQGKIIGLAITGSHDGFDVINEV
jgi:hypothetical protein